MLTMIEALEGREMFSVSVAVTPAAPSPVPSPYPIVVDDASTATAKVNITPFSITKKIDKSSPALFMMACSGK